MNDVVFTEAELLALRHQAMVMALTLRPDAHERAEVDWQLLGEKLTEAARQAGAVQAAHRAYLAHINAQQMAAEADRSRYAPDW